jgi:hypothetical protein
VKAHRTDKLSLIFGLIFIGLSLSWAFGWLTNWRLRIQPMHFGLLVAGGLIVLGIFGLLRSLRSARRTDAGSGPDGPG